MSSILSITNVDAGHFVACSHRNLCGGIDVTRREIGGRVVIVRTAAPKHELHLGASACSDLIISWPKSVDSIDAAVVGFERSQYATYEAHRFGEFRQKPAVSSQRFIISLADLDRSHDSAHKWFTRRVGDFAGDHSTLDHV